MELIGILATLFLIQLPNDDPGKASMHVPKSLGLCAHIGEPEVTRSWLHSGLTPAIRDFWEVKQQVEDFSQYVFSSLSLENSFFQINKSFKRKGSRSVTGTHCLCRGGVIGFFYPISVSTNTHMRGFEDQVYEIETKIGTSHKVLVFFQLGIVCVSICILKTYLDTL